MKTKHEIILSGVGGQGLVRGGLILGEAATIYENINAILSSSFGVETRGSFTKSDVIISKDEICYQQVVNPDLILALAQVAYDRYVTETPEDCILVYDSTTVEENKDFKGKQLGFPILEMAREAGYAGSANIVALGIIIKLTEAISLDSIISALGDNFGHKQSVLDLNIKALKMGYDIA